MKIIIISLFITFIVFKNNTVLANEKIAFIDLNYILKNLFQVKKILNDLNSINNKNLEKFRAEEFELEKQQDEIQKLKNIISLEEYNKKLSSFQNKVDIYKEKKTKIINSFEETKDKELKIFFNKLNEIMNVYMQNNSINIILDKKNIIMANTQNDISKQILNIVNQNE